MGCSALELCCFDAPLHRAPREQETDDCDVLLQLRADAYGGSCFMKATRGEGDKRKEGVTRATRG